jgi:hypothetical protein
MEDENELQRFLCKLESEIRDGLEHGFFKLCVHCEVVKGSKRRLTIKAGKSHQFVIAEQELRRVVTSTQMTPANGASKS